MRHPAGSIDPGCHPQDGKRLGSNARTGCSTFVGCAATPGVDFACSSARRGPLEKLIHIYPQICESAGHEPVRFRLERLGIGDTIPLSKQWGRSDPNPKMDEKSVICCIGRWMGVRSEKIVRIGSRIVRTALPGTRESERRAERKRRSAEGKGLWPDARSKPLAMLRQKRTRGIAGPMIASFFGKTRIGRLDGSGDRQRCRPPFSFVARSVRPAAAEGEAGALTPPAFRR